MWGISRVRGQPGVLKWGFKARTQQEEGGGAPPAPPLRPSTSLSFGLYTRALIPTARKGSTALKNSGLANH